MEAEFRWTGPFIADNRSAVKTIHEYHCLERYARQYHVVGEYKVSAEHWLIAAAWRDSLMDANNLSDEEHLRAVEFAVKNYEYNMALFRWQKRQRRSLPSPESFGLRSDVMERKDATAERELLAIYDRSAGANEEPGSRQVPTDARETSRSPRNF
jgi:hypothetical protein